VIFRQTLQISGRIPTDSCEFPTRMIIDAQNFIVATKFFQFFSAPNRRTVFREPKIYDGLTICPLAQLPVFLSTALPSCPLWFPAPPTTAAASAIITTTTTTTTTVCTRKKCPNLFLAELRQMSTKFDNFWQTDSQNDKIM